MHIAGQLVLPSTEPRAKTASEGNAATAVAVVPERTVRRGSLRLGPGVRDAAGPGLVRRWRAALIIITAGLLSSSGLAAQTPPAPVCPPSPVPDQATFERVTRTPQPDRGLLYEISRDGHRAHLYGTLHVAKLEWAVPGPTIAKTLRQATQLLVELDPTDPSLPARLSGLLAERPDQPSVAGLSIAQQARVKRLITAGCLEPKAFEDKPAALAVAGLLALSARDAGFYPDLGIDASLVGFARAVHKPVVALETVEEQADLVAFSEDELETMLAQIDSGEAREGLLQIAAAWASGDEAGLAQALVCEPPDCDRQRHARLFDDRNEVMAERISARMKYVGGDFFAVGAGHLVGERNLLDALRARGFTMRRLVPGDAPVAPETAPEEAGSPTRSERPGRAGESGQAGTTP